MEQKGSGSTLKTETSTFLICFFLLFFFRARYVAGQASLSFLIFSVVTVSEGQENACCVITKIPLLLLLLLNNQPYNNIYLFVSILNERLRRLEWSPHPHPSVSMQISDNEKEGRKQCVCGVLLSLNSTLLVWQYIPHVTLFCLSTPQKKMPLHFTFLLAP